MKKLISGLRFGLGIALHEDYDGRGIYLYEINNAPPSLGPTLLRAGADTLPIDLRQEIEGWPFRKGLLTRRIEPAEVPSLPEALAVFPRHAPRFVTFETPSEFSLALRVESHVRVIEACIRSLARR